MIEIGLERIVVANDTFYVKFFAPINVDSVTGFMQIVDRKLKQGAKRLKLLISCSGGDVFQGLSVYNYLKGIPLEIETHNFGSADSMGVVLFCAGERRYSVPHARFLLHGPTINFRNPISMEEQQLEEKLRMMQIDMGNIARVVADTINVDREAVMDDMLNRLVLFPEEAVEYGLVHEIRSDLIPEGAELYAIHMSTQQRPTAQRAQKKAQAPRKQVKKPT